MRTPKRPRELARGRLPCRTLQSEARPPRFPARPTQADPLRGRGLQKRSVRPKNAARRSQSSFSRTAVQRRARFRVRRLQGEAARVRPAGARASQPSAELANGAARKRRRGETVLRENAAGSFRCESCVDNRSDVPLRGERTKREGGNGGDETERGGGLPGSAAADIGERRPRDLSKERAGTAPGSEELSQRSSERRKGREGFCLRGCRAGEAGRCGDAWALRAKRRARQTGQAQTSLVAVRRKRTGAKGAEGRL